MIAMEEVFNAYCETTKTCTWKRLRMPDKEEAVDLGEAHALEKHPEVGRWRVRVQTIRLPTAKKKQRSSLWR